LPKQKITGKNQKYKESIFTEKLIERKQSETKLFEKAQFTDNVDDDFKNKFNEVLSSSVVFPTLLNIKEYT
jgi:hypothetical protein